MTTENKHPDERAAIAQNLRDDAAALRHNEKRHALAENMERAAELLEARATTQQANKGARVESPEERARRIIGDPMESVTVTHEGYLMNSPVYDCSGGGCANTGLIEALRCAAAPQAVTLSDEQRELAHRALHAAKNFIVNGVELGFIRMPDADCPDPALQTPKLIDDALNLLGHPTEQRMSDAGNRPAKSHCQNGGDVCLAGNRDGVCCPEDSCDIDDGTRNNPLDAARKGDSQ